MPDMVVNILLQLPFRASFEAFSETVIIEAGLSETSVYGLDLLPCAKMSAIIAFETVSSLCMSACCRTVSLNLRSEKL